MLWSGQSGVWLLQGLLTTLEISVLAWLVAVFLGVLAGALRTVTFRPLRDTIRDTLTSHKTKELNAGLDRDKERALLYKWHAQT